MPVKEHKVHFAGTDMVPPLPGTKGWNRVIARGCGGYQRDTMDGPDYGCDHEYTWTCDDCPVCITFQEEKHQQWLKDMATVQGPPRRNPPDNALTGELWWLWPEVEAELCWIKEQA